MVTLTDPVTENGSINGVVASNLALDKLIEDVLAIQVPGNGRVRFLSISKERSLLIKIKILF
ncbi:hypothetical protein O9993_15485 [Vibrio lentus]|nr:hypothetical protein [Vibrio lentus]